MNLNERQTIEDATKQFRRQFKSKWNEFSPLRLQEQQLRNIFDYPPNIEQQRYYNLNEQYYPLDIQNILESINANNSCQKYENFAKQIIQSNPSVGSGQQIYESNSERSAKKDEQTKLIAILQNIFSIKLAFLKLIVYIKSIDRLMNKQKGLNQQLQNMLSQLKHTIQSFAFPSLQTIHDQENVLDDTDFNIPDHQQINQAQKTRELIISPIEQQCRKQINFIMKLIVLKKIQYIFDIRQQFITITEKKQMENLQRRDFLWILVRSMNQFVCKFLLNSIQQIVQSQYCKQQVEVNNVQDINKINFSTQRIIIKNYYEDLMLKLLGKFKYGQKEIFQGIINDYYKDNQSQNECNQKHQRISQAYDILNRQKDYIQNCEIIPMLSDANDITSLTKIYIHSNLNIHNQKQYSTNACLIFRIISKNRFLESFYLSGFQIKDFQKSCKYFRVIHKNLEYTPLQKPVTEAQKLDTKQQLDLRIDSENKHYVESQIQIQKAFIANLKQRDLSKLELNLDFEYDISKHDGMNDDNIAGQLFETLSEDLKYFSSIFLKNAKIKIIINLQNLKVGLNFDVFFKSLKSFNSLQLLFKKDYKNRPNRLNPNHPLYVLINHLSTMQDKITSLVFQCNQHQNVDVDYLLMKNTQHQDVFFKNLTIILANNNINHYSFSKFDNNKVKTSIFSIIRKIPHEGISSLQVDLNDKNIKSLENYDFYFQMSKVVNKCSKVIISNPKTTIDISQLFNSQSIENLQINIFEEIKKLDVNLSSKLTSLKINNYSSKMIEMPYSQQLLELKEFKLKKIQLTAKLISLNNSKFKIFCLNQCKGLSNTHLRMKNNNRIISILRCLHSERLHSYSCIKGLAQNYKQQQIEKSKRQHHNAYCKLMKEQKDKIRKVQAL